MTKRLLPLFLLVFFQSVNAQFLSNQKNVSQYQGLFNFHYDQDTDKIFMEVEHLDKEFLYV